MQPTRHAFAGANTCTGFVSYFSELLPQDQARRLFILKGGPGVGKSSFMNKLADALLARDLDVEYLHCSSDPDSLDAIVCHSLGIAALDGTAPHVVDPRLPGAVDGIINLGMYLDEKALHPLRHDLRALNREKASFFDRAYRYLAAAAPLYEDAAQTLAQVTDAAKVEALFAPWLQTLCAHREPTASGRERHLFAQALTPLGRTQYLNTFALPRIWRILGPWGSDVHALLARLRDTALLYGLDVDSVMDPFLAGRIAHLVIPGLGLFITSGEETERLQSAPERVLDLADAQSTAGSLPETSVSALAFERLTFDHLLSEAMDCLAHAKAIHARMESHYVVRMDFASAQTLFDDAWSHIQKIIECFSA